MFQIKILVELEYLIIKVIKSINEDLNEGYLRWVVIKQ